MITLAERERVNAFGRQILSLAYYSLFMWILSIQPASRAALTVFPNMSDSVARKT